MGTKKETAGAHLTELQRAGTDAKQVADLFGGAIKECGAIASQLDEFIEADEAAHQARLVEIQDNHNERLAKLETEIKADTDRLISDLRAKDAKNKEIQSKFSFVLGTVTERTASEREDPR